MQSWRVFGCGFRTDYAAFLTALICVASMKLPRGKSTSDITDFSCIGYDFDYMICSFTKPRNAINTKYGLQLTTNLDNYGERCKLIMEYPRYICNITIITRTILISREMYTFNLTATNSLGSISQIFTINNYETVVPAKINFEITNITSDSVSLNWRIKKFAFYHRHGLDYKISLQPQGFSLYNATKIDNCTTAYCSLTIMNLKYAYREYTIIVRAKVKTALDDDFMWSSPSIGIFRTRPTLPIALPKIAAGSFYIESMETQVRLYWQKLADYEENGPGFFYTIKAFDMSDNLINTKTSNDSSVTFTWSRGIKYKYEIVASNSLGHSARSSKMHVYPLQAELFAPNTVATSYHNNTYTLFWRPPVLRTHLVNYTVFWCVSKMESLDKCRGSIYFQYIDKNAVKFTTQTQDHTINLAISANYVNGSAGMQWSRCSADVTSDLIKLEPHATVISATTIKLQWSSETVCHSIIEGYNLSYCQVSTSTSSNKLLNLYCLTPTKTIMFIGDQMDINGYFYNIQHLTPNTPYRIEISMYSNTKVGPNSDALYVTTKEAAPSAPRNTLLNESTLTSNSVVISWLPPLKANGIIKYYKIWKVINGTTTSNDSEKLYINTEASVEIEDELVLFKLEGLNSYTCYKVYVTAHNSKQSEPSNLIHFKTLVGRPTNPLKVNIVDKGVYGILRWDVPEMPAGRVEYYEVVMTLRQMNKETTSYEEIETSSYVKENFCKFKYPTCVDYYLKVRAINVAENNKIDNDTDLSTKSKKRSLPRDLSIRQNINGPNDSQGNDVHFSKTSVTLAWRENITNESILEAVHNSAKLEMLDSFDFSCVDSIPVITSAEFTLLPSSWERAPNMYMRCSEYPINRVIKIALFILLLSAILALTFWLCKKYNKMKSIEAVLPTELLEQLPNYKSNYEYGIGYQAKFSCNNDSLINQKHSLRLLMKIYNRTAKASSLNQSTNHYALKGKNVKFEQSNLAVHGPTAAFETDSGKVIHEKYNYFNQYTGSIKTVLLETALPSNLTHDRTVCKENTTRSLQQNGLKLMLDQDEATCDYTTLNNITAYPTSSTATNALPIQTSNIKAESVIETNPAVSIYPENSSNSTVKTNNAICGYVTQRQLAAFGQLLN